MKPSLVLKKEEKKFSMREIFFSLIKNGRLYGLTDQNPFYHIGTPDDFSKAKKNLA